MPSLSMRCQGTDSGQEGLLNTYGMPNEPGTIRNENFSYAVVAKLQQQHQQPQQKLHRHLRMSCKVGLPPSQHHHGILEQLHRVVQHVLAYLKNKQYSSAVFLDIQQTFDRETHDDLLFKLKSLQPSAQYLLLWSYLLVRSFMLEDRDERSNIRRIGAGVPQCNVLGLALCTLFTAGLLIPVARNKLLATYADGTVLLTNSTTGLGEQLRLHRGSWMVLVILGQPVEHLRQ
ncbi:GH19586 [Drosophila grimshawi]|uniref:GH19586 n=1 Tax=Drosophila grimshawi TaxID=7222 RepID=B4JHS1_DROGR|nr:GH19586 [Drosophila grimshawi]